MSDLLASVVIPVTEGCDALRQCLDAVMRQDFGKREVVIVCDARAAGAALPEGSEEVRVIQEASPTTAARLVNDGMRAARGQVKVLLEPYCLPTDSAWLRGMVEPFDDETVGVVLSRCVGEHTGSMARRLLDAVDATESCETSLPRRGRPLVSHRCDAYRASLLADIGYFSEALPSPADAIDFSLKVADAGYSIVISERSTVTCGTAPDRRSLADALRTAVEHGRADALLDKAYDMHWLNAGLYAVTLFSLLLPLVAALTLPVAVVLALAIFLWGWMLSARLPVVHWDVPVAPLQGLAYVAVILAVRGTWWPWLFGWTMHPAVIRQWCWIAATAGAYLLVLGWTSIYAGARACRRRGGVAYAAPIVLLAALWRLLSGVGYLRAALLGSRGADG
jgi:GT2 family glycosyltransferase